MRRHSHADVHRDVLEQVAGGDAGPRQLPATGVVHARVAGQERAVAQDEAAGNERPVEHVGLHVHRGVLVVELPLAD